MWNLLCPGQWAWVCAGWFCTCRKPPGSLTPPPFSCGLFFFKMKLWWNVGAQRRSLLLRKRRMRRKLSTICPPQKIFCEWAVPAVPCAPPGLMDSPALLLSNRESADRWPSQSGSLSVKVVQGAAVDVMPTTTDTKHATPRAELNVTDGVCLFIKR